MSSATSAATTQHRSGKRRVFTRRRLILLVIAIILLAVAWTAWLAWRTAEDLRAAEDAVTRLEAAVDSGDDAARAAAVADLQEAASSAHDNTDGLLWGALTLLPAYGDDAAGVEALSASLDVLASDGVAPALETADSLDGLVSGGGVDLDRLTALQQPVGSVAGALREATSLVGEQDSSGFTGALRTRYDDYATRVSELSQRFEAAETAVGVLPDMLGADGPRDYLFIFQNNAEIRATGGIPGSWARIHAEDGTIELQQQGSAGDFGDGSRNVAELTAEETAVYDQLPVRFFQDTNFTPDFPRAAELVDAFWTKRFPRVGLDGVISLDPVGMSYLMAGTGPVPVGDVTLTADTIVTQLLSNTYAQVEDPAEQDKVFESVARALFGAVTGNLASPVDFITGVDRAVDEGRFLVAPFDDTDVERLAGSAVVGALPGDDGPTPHVDVAINDATGAKMSYYLRYDGEVTADSCADGVQQLTGTMNLQQTISEADAQKLPPYVTGDGLFGIPIGSQLPDLYLFGPYGGTITGLAVDGEPQDVKQGLMIDGRPVVKYAPIVSAAAPTVVTWEMSTGPGQTGAGQVGLTPGIEPRNLDSEFASACS